MTRVSDALRERQTGTKLAQQARRDPRQSALHERIWTEMRPAAVTLVMANDPFSFARWKPDGTRAHIGNNQALFPGRLVGTQAEKDIVRQTYDRHPLKDHVFSVKFWVWCFSARERDALEESVTQLMAARAEESVNQHELRDGWYDLGPDLDLAQFEMEVHDIARRLGIPAGDKAWIVGLVGAAERVADELASRAERSVDQWIVEKAAALVVTAERERWGRG